MLLSRTKLTGSNTTHNKQCMFCYPVNSVFKNRQLISQTSMNNHASEAIKTQKRKYNARNSNANSFMFSATCDNTERFAIANVLHHKFLNMMQEHKEHDRLHDNVSISNIVTEQTLLNDTAPVPHIWKQLNNLRIMHRFIRNTVEMTRTNNFLCGNEVTCVMGLQWMSTLKKPIQTLDHETRQAVMDDIQRASKVNTADTGTISHGESAFNTCKLLICPDDNHTRYLLQLHSDSLTELDVQICNSMIKNTSLSYSEWKHEFSSWMEKGLFYPLAVAASYMPSLDHWLPKTLHSTPLAISWQCTLQDINENGCHRDMFDALAAEWAMDKTHTSTILSNTFDRIAVLMRVKSDGRNNFSLAKAMHELQFTDALVNMHIANKLDWINLSTCIENALPPSMLCRALTVFKRPSWGYNNLKLQVTQNGALRFEPQQLTWHSGTEHNEMLALVPGCHAYIPVLNSTCHPTQTSWRVQDMLCRLGEVACSYDIASCMLFPHTMSQHFHLGSQCTNEAVLSMCTNPELVLKHMQQKNYDDNTTHNNQSNQGLSTNLSKDTINDPAYMLYTTQLESIQPNVVLHEFDATQHLLMWRLDIPPRPIVYTGPMNNIINTTEEAYMEFKCMLNCRMPNTCVSDIRFVTNQVNVKNIKADIMSKFTDLAEIHETGMVQVKQLGNIMTTTMIEAVACLTMKEATHHTEIALGASVPWESTSGIDPRYSELQEGSNGIR